MAYKVIRRFSDVSDGGRVYKKNDVYPHKGAPQPTAERLKVLASEKNNTGAPVIKEIKTAAESIKEKASDTKK